MPIRRVLPVLPGYAWDSALHNYVDLATGRMVSRNAILGLLDDFADGMGDSLARLARAASNDVLTPRQFYEAMRRQTKHAYNASTALGSGGWDRVTQAEWGRNGGYLKQEYERLRTFAEDIASGNLSQAQIEARARLYADSAFNRFWQIDEGNKIADGYEEERWLTVNDKNVCLHCRDLEAREWQPIGSMPIPGTVHAGCRCRKEYRRRPT